MGRERVRSVKPWPPLPKVVHGAGGPITVKMVNAIEPDPKYPTDTTFGIWESQTRTIRIIETLEPQFRWLTYFHELVHAALSDSGVTHMMTAENEECLADAIGTARLREMRGNDL